MYREEYWSQFQCLIAVIPEDYQAPSPIQQSSYIKEFNVVWGLPMAQNVYFKQIYQSCDRSSIQGQAYLMIQDIDVRKWLFCVQKIKDFAQKELCRPIPLCCFIIL